MAWRTWTIMALHFPNIYDLTPASDRLSFLTDFGIAVGPVFFVVWVILMTGGATNGVNLVDGLDGLATGACIAVLAAYVIIGNWQLRNVCTPRWCRAAITCATRWTSRWSRAQC